MDQGTSYFQEDVSWPDRLQALFETENEESFARANFESLQTTAQDEITGVRMVVNIPADALLNFLRSKRYLNAYSRPVVGGKPRQPSPMRMQIDEWLGFDAPEAHYFGAVAMGGTGVRFYGEYCMVLRAEAVSPETRVFDRNSYDLARPPFAEIEDKQRIVRTLGGSWGEDLVSLVMMKLLASMRDVPWLITLGTISDEILHDEEFIEVHLRGEFSPDDIEEIRQAPEDESVALDIEHRYRAGAMPTTEEMLWRGRKMLVASAIAEPVEGEDGTPKRRVRSRVVVTAGRGNRWR
ncbi:MAG TPA: hypothetical protein VEK79_05420 [Thermoanaerobaculia bacterium]|nr:hypothetical protein [Thermoanaerobaculia bacterium]